MHFINGPLITPIIVSTLVLAAIGIFFIWKELVWSKFVTFIIVVILLAAYFFLFVGASNLDNNPIIIQLTRPQALGITIACAIIWGIVIGLCLFLFIVYICAEVIPNKREREQQLSELNKEKYKINNQIKTKDNQTENSYKKTYTITIGKQNDNIPSSLVNKIIDNIYKEILKKSEFESYVDAINNSKNIEIKISTKSKYEKIISILNKFEIVYSMENNK